MKSKRGRSADDLFSRASTRWTKIPGGLPHVRLQFNPSVIVKPGGPRMKLQGLLASGGPSPPANQPQTVLVTTIETTPPTHNLSARPEYSFSTARAQQLASSA